MSRYLDTFVLLADALLLVHHDVDRPGDPAAPPWRATQLVEVRHELGRHRRLWAAERHEAAVVVGVATALDVTVQDVPVDLARCRALEGVVALVVARVAPVLTWARDVAVGAAIA